MRVTWSALHLQFLSFCHRESAERLYREMRQRHSELAAPFIDGLLLRQRDPDCRHDRNAVLRTLVLEAQATGPTAGLAATILILTLWPGMDAVHGRLCREFPLDRADHAGEITSRVAIAIARLDLTSVTRIAATLVRNVERDIRRSLVARRARQRAEVMFADDLTDGSVGLAEHVTALKDWQHRLVSLKPRDATFLLRMLVLGETQEEAGRALGLSHDAARKRYQRAVARLRPS